MVRGLDEHFPGETFSLRHVFLEERRRVLDRVIRATLERHEETYHRVWEESRALARYLREVDVPVPEVFRLTARHVLEERVAAELLPSLAAQRAIPARVFEFVEEAGGLGLQLDLAFAAPAMRQAARQALGELARGPEPATVAEVLTLLKGAQRLGIGFGRWAAQNAFFALWRQRPDARGTLQPLATALGFALSAREPA